MQYRSFAAEQQLASAQLRLTLQQLLADIHAQHPARTRRHLDPDSEAALNQRILEARFATPAQLARLSEGRRHLVLALRCGDTERQHPAALWAWLVSEHSAGTWDIDSARAHYDRGSAILLRRGGIGVELSARRREGAWRFDYDTILRLFESQWPAVSCDRGPEAPPELAPAAVAIEAQGSGDEARIIATREIPETSTTLRVVWNADEEGARARLIELLARHQAAPAAPLHTWREAETAREALGAATRQGTQRCYERAQDKDDAALAGRLELELWWGPEGLQSMALDYSDIADAEFRACLLQVARSAQLPEFTPDPPQRLRATWIFAPYAAR